MSNNEYIAIKGDQVAELIAENAELRKNYNDLLYQVEKRHPRYDTHGEGSACTCFSVHERQEKADG